MHLRPLTVGKVSGTGTITDLQGCSSFVILLSTDGTNAGAVVIRKDDENGDILLDLSSIDAGQHPLSPILNDNASALHYNISGTGAAAQVFGYLV